MVVYNYYYLLTLFIIHSLRTSIWVCKYLYMLSFTFDERGGAGPMTVTFPSTSAGPGPHSATLKFYIYSAEIAIPLRVILIPVFHTWVGEFTCGGVFDFAIEQPQLFRKQPKNKNKYASNNITYYWYSLHFIFMNI